MATIPLLNEEMEGDQDTVTYFLKTPVAAVGGTAPGETLVADILTRHNGARLLVISAGAAGSGDFDIPVRALAPDAENVLLVVPKDQVPPHVGQNLVVTEVPDPDGEWTLVAALPPAA